MRDGGRIGGFKVLLYAYIVSCIDKRHPLDQVLSAGFEVSTRVTSECMDGVGMVSVVQHILDVTDWFNYAQPLHDAVKLSTGH